LQHKSYTDKNGSFNSKKRTLYISVMVIVMVIKQWEEIELIELSNSYVPNS